MHAQFQAEQLSTPSRLQVLHSMQSDSVLDWVALSWCNSPTVIWVQLECYCLDYRLERQTGQCSAAVALSSGMPRKKWQMHMDSTLLSTKRR